MPKGDEMVDGDVHVVTGGSAPSSRQPLDRQRIVSTAVSFIDEHGLAGLSMRRLGSLLGVEAMSLYRYVPGRENLLDAVVASILSQMEEDEEILSSPRDGWQDFLIRLAHGVRRVALSHPNAFPLVASRPVEAPWLRPPLRSMVWVEAFLDGLIGEGFTDEAAAAAYRGFTSFLLGHLLLEVSALGADVGPLDVVDDGETRNERPQTYPTIERLRPALSQDHSALEFEEALESLVNRIALIQAES
jgi:AcrR family transcriptional regulator